MGWRNKNLDHTQPVPSPSRLHKLRQLAHAGFLLCLLSGSVLGQDTGEAAIPCPLDGASDQALQADLERLLVRQGLKKAADANHLTVVLLLLDDLEHPKLAQVNGDQMYYAASLPKIAILLGAAVELERGELKMDRALHKDLHDMIRVSCNSCATRVLNRVGHEELLDILQEPQFQFYDPQHNGGLWVGKEYAAGQAYHRDPIAGLSHGATALQAARFYCALQEGDLVSPEQNALMLEALAKPGIEHKFVKALKPFKNVKMYRKSGTWKQYHADSALVRVAGKAYVMVAMAKDKAGSVWLERLGAGLHKLATTWQKPVKRNVLADSSVPGGFDASMPEGSE